MLHIWYIGTVTKIRDNVYNPVDDDTTLFKSIAQHQTRNKKQDMARISIIWPTYATRWASIWCCWNRVSIL